MTHFDEIVRKGKRRIQFAGHFVEVPFNANIYDIIEELRGLAHYLAENNGDEKTLYKAARYFHIPREFAEELWDEVTEYAFVDERTYA